MQYLFERATAVGMTAERTIRKGLKDFELFAAFLAAVLIGRHSAINQGLEGQL